jgi:hypothetical protein
MTPLDSRTKAALGVKPAGGALSGAGKEHRAAPVRAATGIANMPCLTYSGPDMSVAVWGGHRPPD